MRMMPTTPHRTLPASRLPRYRTWMRVVVLTAAAALVAVAGAISSGLLRLAPGSRGEPAGSSSRAPSREVGPIKRWAGQGAGSSAMENLLQSQSTDTTRLGSNNQVPPNTDAAPRPAETAAMPKPPLDSTRGTSPRSDGPVTTPARSLEHKHANSVVHPIGHLAGRPAGDHAESPRNAHTSGGPAESPAPAKGVFPRASFDLQNPYGTP